MTDPEEDFAAMLEASVKAAYLDKGQSVEGTVVAIGEEVAFVDVGGKGEATIDLAELRDADGGIEVAVGDRIQAIVMSTGGGITLSRRLARRGASDRQIEDVYRARLPVEGRIERAVKGGYEVRIGGQRAFCPLSQVGSPGADRRRSKDRCSSSASSNTARAAEISSSRAGPCSRRNSRPGPPRSSGRSSSARSSPDESRRIRDFGAFVDLGGGVQGLLHVSEMAWSRVTAPADVVKTGDEITVKVLRVDEDGKKIALGLRQLTADPWTKVSESYEVGQTRVGRVTRVADFGAFVELEPGIEALAHESTFAPTGQSGNWSTSVTPGTVGVFEILNIDLERKRIGVALIMKGEAPARIVASSSAAIVPGARLKGKVERHERFGVFVFLAPGRTGLIPMRETGVSEADVRKSFPVGAEVEVVVLEVDAAGRRIRLSAKAVQDAKEADEVREYQERAGAPSSDGLGSLADKLRGALGTRRG